MDTRLIEALLIELLKLPAERFTQDKILANLTLAATAAGLSLSTEGSTLQREHLQLAAALEHLAADLGSQYRARAMLRLGAGLDGIELGAVIEPIDSTSTLPRFVAFGSSARATLAGIGADIRKASQPHTQPAPPRLAGRVSLKRLADQLADDKATAA
ncbi:hypothetical protein EA796_06725 [Pseudomonas sp. AOB-7]|uniref:hypothetical protein n=1 Tax=Pseudomonas sp. AOB-7 TaxID=2482750 RepID=UPI000EFAE7C3|nr:hypothetical protein [Pseudomonas sp. AOB-7]RMH85197.1 hypothetical protein EA796_06725 [Pseudomonas sp. AOB-7]